MWDLPGPGLEPVSPALAGGFLTTEPPGKSQHADFLIYPMENLSQYFCGQTSAEATLGETHFQTEKVEHLHCAFHQRKVFLAC